MSRIPTMKSVMTPFPYSIGPDDDLAEARRRMTEAGIRHLPVLAAGEPVGVVTQRDVERVESIQAATGRAAPAVREICRYPAYVVPIDEPLDNVLLHMAKERIGSALVGRGDRIVGIFTTTDACRQFAECLRRDEPGSGDDAA